MNRAFILLLSVILIVVYARKGDAQHLRDVPEIPSGTQFTVGEYSNLSTDSLIQSLINQTHLDTLIKFVNILSGEDSVAIYDSTYLLLSRNVLHPHNNLAADYIFQTLSRFGLPCFNQNYSSTGRNVYAIQMGTDYPNQKFIICAHYDDMPIQPPAPGADDNASGVAAVLEAARLLSQIETQYTIIYALWDEEEVGLMGSAYFAQQASQSGEDILGVVNLDMIGWDSNDDGLFEIHTGPVANSVELADLIYDLENEYNIGLSADIYNPGLPNSDHSSFWNQGYTAVILIEAYYGGDFNLFYHSSNDRIMNFNLDYFHKLSKLAVATIAHLAFYDLTSGDLAQNLNTLISGFELKQNYPNPFNSITNIEIRIPNSEFVTIKVYNQLGQEVATLLSASLLPGSYRYEWDAPDLASGVYLYRLEAGQYAEVRKMILMK